MALGIAVACAPNTTGFVPDYRSTACRFFTASAQRGCSLAYAAANPSMFNGTLPRFPFSAERHSRQLHRCLVTYTIERPDKAGKNVEVGNRADLVQNDLVAADGNSCDGQSCTREICI